MDIGSRIKEIRLKKKITQKELAKKTEFAEITIRQYESGKREPRMEQLQKIADALDVHVLVLLGSISEKFSDSIKHSVDINSAFIELFRYIYGKVDLSPLRFDNAYILGEKGDIKISQMDFDNICEDIENLIIQSVKQEAIYEGNEPSYNKNYIPSDRYYSDDVNLLLHYFKLNTTGKMEAVKRVKELTEVSRYTDK